VNKSDLVDSVSKMTALTKREAEHAVNAVFHAVMSEVKAGRRVSLAGPPHPPQGPDGAEPADGCIGQDRRIERCAIRPGWSLQRRGQRPSRSGPAHRVGQVDRHVIDEKDHEDREEGCEAGPGDQGRQAGDATRNDKVNPENRRAGPGEEGSEESSEQDSQEGSEGSSASTGEEGCEAVAGRPGGKPRQERRNGKPW